MLGTLSWAAIPFNEPHRATLSTGSQASPMWKSWMRWVMLTGDRSC